MVPKIAVIGIAGKSTFMYVDHFHRKGETLVADSVFDEVGGKGLNQAIAAKRMGAKVTFLCALGDDENCEMCRKTVHDNGIYAHFKIKEGKETPFAFILTDTHGENQVTEFKSAELCEEDVSTFENEIKESDVLLLQHEVPDEVNIKAVEIAKKYGVKVILNPAPARMVPDEIKKDIFLVTPNEEEAKVINPEEFENCIKTLGSDGCIVNDRLHIDPIKVKAVDTTGAGDTFSGTLAVCIAEGMNMAKAAKYATAASGLSVAKNYVTNSIPYRSEVEETVSKMI